MKTETMVMRAMDKLDAKLIYKILWFLLITAADYYGNKAASATNDISREINATWREEALHLEDELKKQARQNDVPEPGIIH